jgi:prepilin-type N-terminal cleavage/methylation domain-containing protein
MRMRNAECGVRSAANAECGIRSAECRPRFTFHVSRFTRHSPPVTRHAFTLIELLAVIAIMGIIAAIALPSLQSLKPNAAAVAARQLLDAVTFARQLALSQRNTVYMVFAPPSLWNDVVYKSTSAEWSVGEWMAYTNLLEKQLTGYFYVTLRSTGDQPGDPHPRHLTSWHALPPGAYIAAEKYQQPAANSGPVLEIYPSTPPVPPAYQVFAFNSTTNIPFPLESTQRAGGFRPYVALPYVAFNGMGQLVYDNGLPATRPELIPITQGSVGIPRDPETKEVKESAPVPRDDPPGNTVNSFNVVCVDQFTGRAHIEHTKVQ